MTTITRIVCDMPVAHCHAPGDAAARHTFGIGGTEYEIDLCVSCDGHFQWVLAGFTAVARKTGTVPRRRRQPVRTYESRLADSELRDWWRKHQDLVERPFTKAGRIPAEVHAARDVWFKSQVAAGPKTRRLA